MRDDAGARTEVVYCFTVASGSRVDYTVQGRIGNLSFRFSCCELVSPAKVKRTGPEFPTQPGVGPELVGKEPSWQCGQDQQPQETQRFL